MISKNIQNSKLQSQLNEIPLEPGCYLFLDKDARILYIGKSKSLRNRVKSYFRSSNDISPRIGLMVKQIDDIEFIVTDTESEALVLESNLIKNHKPYFNILLKDDKKYPYLCITWSEPYPRLYLTRRRRQSHGLDRFYGPFVDVGLLRNTILLVKKLFPLRQRPRPLYKDRTCLNYSIGRCPGVCQELVTPEEYQNIIKKVAMIFQGRTEELRIKLTNQMNTYAENLDYEEAAKVRDQLNGLEQLVENQKMGIPDSSVSRDVVAIAKEKNISCIQIFQMRAGKLVARLGYSFNSYYLDSPSIIQRVLEEHYSNVDPIEIPSDVLVEHTLPQQSLIQTWLIEQCGHRVEISCPKRGKKLQLVELVRRNADYELKRTKTAQEQNTLALEDLAQLLELSGAPKRIEAYDISHISGSDAVASQVVFIDGIPAKQHYRKYKIKSGSITSGHSDDFLALSEVIRRRFKKWSRAKLEGLNIEELSRNSKSRLALGGFNDWPDLIVIDGGKGQLSSVLNVLHELNLQEELNVCSLAKKNEDIYLPNTLLPLDSNPDQLGVRLIRRIRDEAHRFAISFHRQQRATRMNRSRLTEIPGLGTKKIRELFNHFQSIEAIQLASEDQLQAIPGFGPNLAHKVWGYFHPEGNS